MDSVSFCAGESFIVNTDIDMCAHKHNRAQLPADAHTVALSVEGDAGSEGG